MLPATRTSDGVMALDLDTGHIVWTKQLLPDDVYEYLLRCSSREPAR